jgi:hypothetical protein
MTAPDRATELPEDVIATERKARSAPTPLRKFRAYSELRYVAQLALHKLAKKAKEYETALRGVEEEMNFISRHKAKEDIAFRALRGSFSRPERAMATFNDLVRTYPPEYVTTVLQLGAARLATPFGMNLLGMKSASRQAAEDNFDVHVVPALNNILEDQREYLRMLDQRLERLHEQALKAFTYLQDQKSGMEGVLRGYEEEHRTSAMEMAREEADKLDIEEAAMRLSLLPPKLREAETKRLKQAED